MCVVNRESGTAKALAVLMVSIKLANAAVTRSLRANVVTGLRDNTNANQVQFVNITKI